MAKTVAKSVAVFGQKDQNTGASVPVAILGGVEISSETHTFASWCVFYSVSSVLHGNVVADGIQHKLLMTSYL